MKDRWDLFQEHCVLSQKRIKIVQCKSSNLNYQSIRNRHYVANHGCVGQQVHYLIYLEHKIIGIISGASAVYAVKARDVFFGLNKDNKKFALNSIINNIVFRLEYFEKNLGTQILSIWRKQIAIDWELKYRVKVHGFETFVVESECRKGTMYKADNWIFLGETAGSTKFLGKKQRNRKQRNRRIKTNKKLIFAIKIPKTKLCDEYRRMGKRIINNFSGNLLEFFKNKKKNKK